MGNCSAGCKKEFHKSNFNLTHEEPDLVVRSQWENCTGCGVLYLVWRLLAACGIITIFVHSWLVYFQTGNHVWWALYPTNWALTMLTIDAVIQLLVAGVGYKKYRGVWGKTFSYMPWYLKLSWVLSNIATSSGLAMTVSYWIFFAKDYIAAFGLSIESINVHVVNSVYILINLWITAMPVRIYHLIHTFIFFTIYIIFTVVYQLGFSQPTIYATLDWSVKEDLGSTIVFVSQVYAVATGVWLFYYALYRIRVAIYGCTDGRNKRDVILREHRDQPLQLVFSASVPVHVYDNHGYKSTGSDPTSTATRHVRNQHPSPVNTTGSIDATNTQRSFVVLSNIPPNRDQ